MKKLFFLLSVVLFTFASCEGPPGRDGLDGRDGAGTYWFVKTYTIQSNQWTLINGEDQLNSYFRAQISIPKLDRELYERGNVQCYMFQNINNTEVQTPLPFTIPLGEKGTGGGELLWTETVSFDFYPGTITFYVNYSDFYTSNRPGTVTFRVVLTY